MAFITGSRAYGSPHERSDVDLVIRVNKADHEILRRAADRLVYPQGGDEYEKNTGHTCLQFGPLQVICCLDDESYAIWQEGTRQLKSQKPVSRRNACALFQKLHKQRQDSKRKRK